MKMYAEIPYEIEGSICKTKCPCNVKTPVFGYDILVGSINCEICCNNVCVDSAKRIVKCNHPDNFK